MVPNNGNIAIAKILADHKIIIKVLDNDGNPIPGFSWFQTMEILP